MGRLIVGSLVFVLAAGAQSQPPHRPDRAGTNVQVLGNVKPLLASGSDAIRMGRYEEGIRLTSLGLEREHPTPGEKSAALSNLCAAQAALGHTDAAIRSCSESLAIDDHNWRAYSNRSYAYYLKGLYSAARINVEAAAVIAPGADEVRAIRGLINERTLAPHVVIEENR